MKTRFSFILICMFSIAGCQSIQSQYSPISLWSIQSGGSQLYLMASMHALTPDMYPLYDEFNKAYEQAETLVVEVNLNAISAAEISNNLHRYGSYRTGSLQQNLSPATLDLLKGYLAKTAQQMSTYNMMRPWFVSLQIGQQLLSAAGYDPALGIDQHYLMKATGAKQILELESFSEQMKILSSDSPAIQDLSLRASLMEADHASADLAELVTAWQRGDADEIYRIATEPIERYPVLEVQLHRLIDERNTKMVNSIRKYLHRPGTYLVIVGALHMGGRHGILNLLRKDYEVIQQHRPVSP